MLFGRDEAWRALDEVVLSTDQLGSALLRGAAGSGKSALLAEAGALWHRSGVRVVSVPAADGRLLDCLAETTRALLAGHSAPELLDSAAAAARSGATGEDSLPLVHELTRALARLARRKRTALVVEDVDRADPQVRPALSLLVQGARAVGSAVLVSSRSPAADDLRGLADRVLELPELTGSDVTSVISRWGGRKAVDPTLAAALSAALGPLGGNPGTLLSTLRSLRADERLVTVDGHLCLLRPREPIALADDHELLLAIRRREAAAEQLASAIAVLQDPTVDELPVLAEALGADPHSCGAQLDRLIAAGLIRVGPGERLSPAIPALGSALRRNGDQCVRGLPSALASRLLDRAERGDPVDRADLADRIARAEHHVSGPLALEVLVEQADRVRRREPERAADRYRAAAPRLPDADSRRPRVLRAAARLQLRLGRYGQLADDLGAIAAAQPAESAGGPLGAIDDDAQAELAACWIAALLYEERTDELRDVQRLFAPLAGVSIVDEEVTDDGLDRPRGDVGDAVAVLDGLIAHREPERSPALARAVVDVLRLFDSLQGEDDEFQRAWKRWDTRDQLPAPDPDALREAGTVADRATVLDLLLGSGYGRPRTGPLITYQRLLATYHSGDWDAASSAAREMATDAGAGSRTGTGTGTGTATGRQSPTQLLSRAFAAEMCTIRGDLQRAGEWLSDTSDDAPGGHLVSWTRAALRYYAGDPTTAVRQGWRDYLQHRDAGRLAGLERLLGRITVYAHRSGDTENARTMLAELESLHERTRTPSGREVLLMTSGLVDGDSAAVTRSIELARQRGDLFRVLAGHLFNGELTDDPEPWLREAYWIVKQLGIPGARSTVGDRMRELGIPLPRSRSPRAAFSDTEARIVDLVSDGFTNRKIATSVGVSEKTVESHLTRLLALTGCRSRVELAAAHLEGKLPGVAA